MGSTSRFLDEEISTLFLSAIDCAIGCSPTKAHGNTAFNTLQAMGVTVKDITGALNSRKDMRVKPDFIERIHAAVLEVVKTGGVLRDIDTLEQFFICGELTAEDESDCACMCATISKQQAFLREATVLLPH